MPFIPHTRADVEEMLAAIGAPHIESLFDEIPAELRVQSLAGVPEGLNEQQVMRLMQERARQDGMPLNFMGAGAYPHHIPAAVWQLVSRGEFYSAYTPYQAEASQGTLQSIYEFQSMIVALTGMAVANASLYDGATAVAEACLMAVRANRKSNSARVLHAATLNPAYGAVARATTAGQGLALEALAYARADGRVEPAALTPYAGNDITALVIQQPNFFGVLKPPGQWGKRGADIVVGDGQPLGCPLSSGGPYFGFMATRSEFVRQMPGRIVGRTVDTQGRPGFTLTLQAREQHIRRGKATSNICTNQGLLMMAGTIYLALMGAEGLARVANACMARTAGLVAALARLPGVRRAFGSAACFHEGVLLLDRPVAPVLEALAARGIEGGVDLAPYFPELGAALLVCATEVHASADVDRYASTLGEVLGART